MQKTASPLISPQEHTHLALCGHLALSQILLRQADVEQVYTCVFFLNLLTAISQKQGNKQLHSALRLGLTHLQHYARRGANEGQGLDEKEASELKRAVLTADRYLALQPFLRVQKTMIYLRSAIAANRPGVSGILLDVFAA